MTDEDDIIAEIAEDCIEERPRVPLWKLFLLFGFFIS